MLRSYVSAIALRLVIGALLFVAASSASAQAGSFVIQNVLLNPIFEPSPCPPGFVCDNYTRIDVARVGGTAGAATVQFQIVGGTATPGADFYTSPIMIPATLDFPDGFAGPRSVVIVPIQDHILEPEETVLVALANPTGGATIGSPSTVTIVIRDTSGLAANQNVPTLGPVASALCAGLLAAAGWFLLRWRM
jgi:hypothetical protein